ncbi:MAG: glycoside hydrolase family 44 protein [Actinomycetota bacterium]
MTGTTPNQPSGPSRHRRRRRSPRTVVAVAMAAVALTVVLIAVNLPASAAAPTTLYDDSLGAGIENWSWGDVDLTSTDPVAEGDRAIRTELEAWEALYLAAPNRLNLPLDGELRFAIHGGANAGDSAVVQVQLLGVGGGAGTAVQVTAPTGRWTEVAIPLRDLGGFTSVEGVWWQEARGTTLAPIHVDDITIVTTDSPPPTGGPTLTVDTGPRTITRAVRDPYTDATTQVRIDFPHAISDDVYGLNFAPNTLREELDVPVNRWGGNSTERYNHRTGSSNAGNDWYFATTDGDVGGDHAFEAGNAADGTKSILTIPLMGWVSTAAEATCSFPTNDSLGAANNAGTQDSSITHWLDPSVGCGSGYRSGQFLGPADPTVTSTAIDESWARDWVAELVATHGSAADGGVELYALGNEPGLWHSTHGDIRGDDPIGRQEIIDRNLTYARAVKSADPTAEVIGPVLWSGYSYYVTTPEIQAGRYPGQLPTFAGDYLANMAAAEASGGVRLLDRLAVNFYDDRVYNGGSDTLRLEATRSLWDPTYAPQDWWVTRDFLEGDGSTVIPRLRSLIDANYPGTGLAITEYNFGGVDSIAGALAQADALGIMGREGLDLATLWEPYADWVGMAEDEFSDRPVFWAFRLFRNYDGFGGRFGDTSVYASSSDESAVSIHAATRSADGALTLLVINKSTVAQATPLEVNGFGGTGEAFRYSGADLESIERVGDVVVGPGTVLDLPARSATLLVIPEGGGGGATTTTLPTTTTTAPTSTSTTSGPSTTVPSTEPTTTVPSTEPTVTVPSTLPTSTSTTVTEPPSGVELPTVANGAVWIDPPRTMAEGGPLDSDEATWVWLERGPVTLEQPVTVNRITSGDFTGRTNENAIVPAGTRVCSFRMWADRLNDNGRLEGSLRFDRSTVLGVIHRPNDVRASEFLRPDGTRSRIGPLESGDNLSLTRDARGTALWWDLRLVNGLDGARILTDCG